MWRVQSDDGSAKANIEAVGKLLHELMPNRDIVLASCNETGIHPKLPRRVWYCPKGPVWVFPGEALRINEYGEWEWGAGSIFDFIEGSN